MGKHTRVAKRSCIQHHRRAWLRAIFLACMILKPLTAHNVSKTILWSCKTLWEELPPYYSVDTHWQSEDVDAVNEGPYFDNSPLHSEDSSQGAGPHIDIDVMTFRNAICLLSPRLVSFDCRLEDVIFSFMQKVERCTSCIRPHCRSSSPHPTTLDMVVYHLYLLQFRPNLCFCIAHIYCTFC